MTETQLVCRLAGRPFGMPKYSDFSIAEEVISEPGAGEFLVRVGHISLDPAMRGWMAEGRSYIAPVAIGEVMRALGVGIVEKSNHPDFSVGQTVVGMFGVQELAISEGKGCYCVDISIAPAEKWLGGLGMPGVTGYFGLLDVAGGAKPRETVVVSAAAGAVGSIVGQIAKMKGARTVGIAGGPEKCAYVQNELGFDACIDYKAGAFSGALKEACPDGIDVYFENVGGDIFDAILPRMNVFGRIAVCGMIANYNATEVPDGPKNLRSILVNRLNMRGFIVFDFISRYQEAIEALANWYGQGKIKINEDVREGGVKAYPDVLNLLYTGGNLGKLVLKV